MRGHEIAGVVFGLMAIATASVLIWAAKSTGGKLIFIGIATMFAQFVTVNLASTLLSQWEAWAVYLPVPLGMTVVAVGAVTAVVQRFRPATRH